MRGVKPSSGVKRDAIPYAFGPAPPPHSHPSTSTSTSTSRSSTSNNNSNTLSTVDNDVNTDGVQGEFWTMMDRCWDEWYLRPNMSELTVWFAGLVKRRESA